MPVSMAGSRGGIIEHNAFGSSKDFIKKLLLGEMDFRELYEDFSNKLCPQNVTLVVNNACNLKCKHCYLQVERFTTAALTEKEWKLLIDSISYTSPELICLSGKEVFLGDVGASLLLYLREVKNRNKKPYRIGLITNGTLVQKHTEDILKAQPTYFDISMDGVGADHDFIRGKGAFDLAFPSVQWAAREFGEKFFVSLTLQKQNYTRLAEITNFFHQNGVKTISCGFYRPLSYTDQSLALSDHDVEVVFEQLLQLEYLNIKHPINILIDLDITNLQPLKAFLRSAWFSFDKILQDVNGECYISHHLKNGVNLELRFAPYPTGIWRSLRITPEGNYIAAEDTIDTSKYKEHAIGNIRDFDYDFTALQAHAITSMRFQEILSEYYNDVLPQLITAYRNRESVNVAA